MATFTPIYKQTTTQSSNYGMPLALGLLVGLLIVGLVVGSWSDGRDADRPAGVPS